MEKTTQETSDALSTETENTEPLLSKGIVGKIHDMPLIELVSIRIKDANLIQRVSESTRKRSFVLRKDWYISLTEVKFDPTLSGKIRIPSKHKNKNGIDETIIYDGASIPVPWLISLFSIGILRPLGVLLIPSLVHDFAFKTGFLYVEKDGKEEKIIVKRAVADRLFRELTAALIKIPFLPWVVWFAVRLGYLLGVPYAGKKWERSEFPFIFVSWALLGLFLVWLLIRITFESMIRPVLEVDPLIGLLTFLSPWLLFYFSTIITLKFCPYKASK